ncbi:hypothetical protein BU16DRAFT_28439 [Lophium mytilinum]|uniref:PARG catalytic Macro domain-containing protein n=1 Tax=Lophium mytilinum TaxID=390894 RepID=A0A6A6RDZ4_9PEZI|nr:hypothetical protein BU16DRAFT_28439 [Lophium mytilinum]
MTYLLPTHLSLSCSDPLGICDEEDPTQADVLSQLIHEARIAPGVSSLATLIEDIAYSIHGNGRLDTSHLRYLLRTNWTDQYVAALQNLLESALRVPDLFDKSALNTLNGPNISSTIPNFPSSSSVVQFTGPQINALLAHQFLGTLSQPAGNTWGLPCFTSWFSGGAAHENAVDGYLATILRHFEHGGYDESASFSFLMQKADPMPNPSQCEAIPDLELVVVFEESETSSSNSEIESPFVLVAAHSQPGPGPTATHEERLQSASPALSISALVSPIIPPDAAVITSAFPLHAAWKGHNRTARLECLIPPLSRPKRHYILADALPLDEADDVEGGGLRDLQAGRMLREVRKLFAAFEGSKVMWSQAEQLSSAPCVVKAVAWGCQAFGGNVLAKCVCMMIAAGLSGVHVDLSLLENRGEDIEAVKEVLSRKHSVSELWKIVESPEVCHCRDSAELKEFILSH